MTMTDRDVSPVKLQREQSEQDLVRNALRKHLWSDMPGRTCSCDWQAENAWMVDSTRPNRVEQWLTHVAEQVTQAKR